MESVLFSYQDSLLLSGAVAVLLFTIIQAYIHPFKNTINNTLDLMFMGIFITLAIVILYLYPNTSGHKECIAVNILGGMAFLLFCIIIIIFHLHDAVIHLTWYSKFMEGLKIKFNTRNVKSDWNPLHSIIIKNVHQKPDNDNARNSSFAHLQESLLEEKYN